MANTRIEVPTVTFVVLQLRVHQLAELCRVANIHLDPAPEEVFNDGMAQVTRLDADVIVRVEPLGQHLEAGGLVRSGEVVDFLAVLREDGHMKIVGEGVDRLTR